MDLFHQSASPMYVLTGIGTLTKAVYMDVKTELFPVLSYRALIQFLPKFHSFPRFGGNPIPLV